MNKAQTEKAANQANSVSHGLSTTIYYRPISAHIIDQPYTDDDQKFMLVH